jgi:hypothetical protein
LPPNPPLEHIRRYCDLVLLRQSHEGHAKSGVGCSLTGHADPLPIATKVVNTQQKRGLRPAHPSLARDAGGLTGPQPGEKSFRKSRSQRSVWGEHTGKSEHKLGAHTRAPQRGWRPASCPLPSGWPRRDPRRGPQGAPQQRACPMQQPHPPPPGAPRSTTSRTPGW